MSKTAFRFLCICLRGALGQRLAPSALPATEVEWEQVLRLSSAHLVLPQLRRALYDQGLFAGIPSDVADYLEAVHTLNLERNLECERQLEELLAILDEAAVRPVLLKGAAAIASGLYPSSSERMLIDLDVLIPAPKMPGILDKMGAAGHRRLPGHRDLVESGDW